MTNSVTHITVCYHCGEEKLSTEMIVFANKSFCCSGCSMVYQLLQHKDLCTYYALHEQPGISMQKGTSTQAFALLDEAELAASFIVFQNQEQTDIIFSIPQMHCSSCLWLLEKLHVLNSHIIGSSVDFANKKIYIQYNHKHISPRSLAELLASVGYTPDLHTKANSRLSDIDRSAILELGVAGFCFANIMMLSFPEYLGLKNLVQDGLSPQLFRGLNFLLATLAVLYSGKSFFKNAFVGIRFGKMNIDVPIVLALIVTLGRSFFDIVSGTGGGYFDSFSGIIFFMLLGRYLQGKVSPTMHFNREVSSYFPVAVAKLSIGGEEIYTKVESLLVGDIIRIHCDEIIPVDADVLRGNAAIDYAFVTGESQIQAVEVGAIVYAGGRQTSTDIDVRVVKPFSLTAFTRLWNNSVDQSKHIKANDFVTSISNHFSIIVLFIALVTWAVRYYFQLTDPIGAAVAVLIVACPCGLLLTSSFTYGFLMNMFSRKGFYMRNGAVLSSMASTTEIFFDKTGTLTTIDNCDVIYKGGILTDMDKAVVAAMLRMSLHPISKRLKKVMGDVDIDLEHVKEVKGAGVEAWYNDTYYKIGSASFIGVAQHINTATSNVWVAVNNVPYGRFELVQVLRNGIAKMLQELPCPITVLSGDDKAMEQVFKQDAGDHIYCLFEQKPLDKYEYVRKAQLCGNKVMMLGDGLNDAGALAESNTGIAVVENTLQFSPSSDAIIEASSLPYLYNFLLASKYTQILIYIVFALSLVYNIGGLYFAITAQLAPIIAAILMPASTVTIVLGTLIGSMIINDRFLKQIPIV
jgi:P-type Cu+ transporter